MSAYSIDLRERIVVACAQGASQVGVAKRFGVCSKTVQRYVGRASRGELALRPLPGAKPRLWPDQEEAFVSWCKRAATGRWMHYVVSGSEGVTCCCRVPRSTATCCVFEDAIKKTQVACERCPHKRAAFARQIALVQIEKLVFLDECGFGLNLYRRYGWTIGGGRCVEDVPFERG